MHIEEKLGVKKFDRPDPPESCRYLWEWFWDIDVGRQSGGFGTSPLSCQEIAAWSSLTGHKLEPWEVRLIRVMDLAFVKAVNNQRS